MKKKEKKVMKRREKENTFADQPTVQTSARPQ